MSHAYVPMRQHCEDCEHEFMATVEHEVHEPSGPKTPARTYFVCEPCMDKRIDRANP